MRISAFIYVLFLISVLGVSQASAKLVSAYEYKAAIRRGKVWKRVDVSKMDLLNGPQGKGSHGFMEEVPCKYEEKDPKNPLGGHTPKFPCWTAEKERLKVKYNHNEVYGEVAGTRLFWALGFPAERMYPVTIVCENCPKDPWTDDGSQKRATRKFKKATVQKKLPGESIGVKKWTGWSWDELDWIDERAGGSPKADVDALRLLAVFVNHVDNTPNQQKVLCAEGDEKCKSPLLMVTDLGGTFGGKGGATSYRQWSKHKIWKDKKACVASMRGTSDSFRDPVISERGRRKLTALLKRLSDKQITDLFKGSRFDILGGEEYPIVAANGKSRKVTIADWVAAFKKKRDDIATAKCPK